jgi:hypothetical protein
MHTLFSLRYLNALVSTVMTVLGHEIMHTGEFILGTLCLNVEKFEMIWTLSAFIVKVFKSLKAKLNKWIIATLYYLDYDSKQ